MYELDWEQINEAAKKFADSITEKKNSNLILYNF